MKPADRLLMLLCALAALLHVPARAQAADRPPNIIFIFADDWGWGDLSAHGSTWAKTPNLDRLIAEGIDFQQFNVLNPVCSPSRSAVMTGHYPARYSIHQHFAGPALNHQRNMPDWLDARAPTLPRLLKQAGYRTAHFGKWHLTNRETYGSPKPEAYGYDEAAVFNGGAEWPQIDTHAAADHAVAFIHAHKQRPFFMNVWIHETHTPHVPTAASLEAAGHLDDEQKRVYAAVVTDGDRAVGRIMQALKQAGVDDQTLVVFSSDNGPESTGPASRAKHQRDPDSNAAGLGTYYSVGETAGLRGRKRSLFEGGVRVPFIVRWPGHAPAGLRNDTTVITAVDLLPTFCAAAGVSLPADYRGDGENMLEAFRGKPVERTRPIFWQWLGNAAEPHWWPRLAVRDGRWKLLMTDDSARMELYDLTADRAESRNLAADHPDIVARLSRMALEWKATLPTQPDPTCRTSVTAPAGPKKKASPAKKTPDRAAAFNRWDTNRDNILSFEEYKAGLPNQTDLDARFKRFDTNGDGKLTRDEFK